MFCAHCGKKIPDGTKFCPSCGADVSAGSQVQNAANQAFRSVEGNLNSAVNDVKNTFQNGNQPYGGERLTDDRSLVVLILLSIITCNIYYYYYIYKLAHDVNIACSGDGEDYTFERITVEAREESRALFCSNGDGVHLQGLRGSLTLRDCRFVGMGDDVLNIHVRAPIVSAVEGDTVTLSYAEGETAGDFAKVGDRVELFSTDGERLGETTVTAVKKNVFTLETMPSGVADGVLVNNLSRQPDTLVDGCFVQRGRARAILLQTAKATVTDSTFRDLRGPGVLIAPDLSQWHEMGPCREAVLDGNTFVNCCSDAESGSWGAITVTVNHNRPLTNAPKIHGSVTLTHNDISDSGPIAISLNGVSEENVTLEDNSLGDAKVLIR